LLSRSSESFNTNGSLAPVIPDSNLTNHIEGASTGETDHGGASTLALPGSLRTITSINSLARSKPTGSFQSHPDRSLKIKTLIRALEALLNEQGEDEVIEAIGRETWDRCFALNSKMKDVAQELNIKDESYPDVLWHLSPEYTGEIVPRMLSGLQLTGLRLSEIPADFPQLPEIRNPILKKAVFTHQGTTGGKATDLSYEKLEWIGDTYIEHGVTLYISQTFNSLSTGQCSQLREKFVKNATLAEFATKYGFEKLANLPESVKANNKYNPLAAKDSSKVKILGDMFEAYVAAVVLSDTEYGLAKAMEWIKALLSITLREDIIREERDATFRREDNPLWNFTKLDLRNPKVDRNPKEILASAIRGPGVKIDYRDIGKPTKNENKITEFKVGVYLTGWGEKDKCLGVGKSTGKKQAGFKAAQDALNHRAQMDQYIARKKLHDEQTKKAQQMLEPALADPFI